MREVFLPASEVLPRITFGKIFWGIFAFAIQGGYDVSTAPVG